jgi:hypothetical protein
MPDPQQQQTTGQAPPPIDFSSVGGTPVSSGAIDFSSIGGKPVAAASVPPAQSTQTQTQASAWDKTEKAIVPAMGGGFIAVDVPAGEARSYEQAHQAGATQAGKIGLTALASMAAPELLPEMEGGGILGYLGRLFARSAASGAGAGVGTAAGQALSGENPLSPENLKQTGIVAGTTAALALPLEAIGQIPFTKIGRSAINQSLGAQTRDVTYGNPAVALTHEGITDVPTGDYEAYKAALRAGQSPMQASQAAGGRFAAVNQRINELSPRLNRLLSQSQTTIPVKDVIDKPLNDATLDIIMNPAMTDLEKDTAINQLGALQKAIKQGLGPNATPSQLQVVKQAIGNRVNWGGNVSVTDDVKPVYRAVYGSLKNAIHGAVPGSAEIDERLTNLLAAHNDLDNLAKAEEVGRGGGLAGGKIGTSIPGMLEKTAGRFLPAATGAPALTGAGAGTISLADSLLTGDKEL